MRPIMETKRRSKETYKGDKECTNETYTEDKETNKGDLQRRQGNEQMRPTQ